MYLKIEKISGFSAKWNAKLHSTLSFWTEYWILSIDFDLTIHQSFEHISLIINDIDKDILCRGIATAMQEEKRKEEKRIRKQFCFFSDEKNKIVLRHVTEWFEIIQALKHKSILPDIHVRP